MTSEIAEETIITATEAELLIQWRNQNHTHYDTIPKNLEKYATLLRSLNSFLYLDYIANYFQSDSEKKCPKITVEAVMLKVEQQKPGFFPSKSSTVKGKVVKSNYTDEIKQAHQKYIENKRLWVFSRQHVLLAQSVIDNLPDDLLQQAVFLLCELVILATKAKDILLPAVKKLYLEIYQTLSDSSFPKQVTIPKLDHLSDMNLKQLDEKFHDEVEKYEKVLKPSSIK